MFTFSFSSAFATTNYNKSLANEYFNVGMDAVKEVGSITVRGDESYEIKYATLEANRDALLELAHTYAKASSPTDMYVGKDATIEDIANADAELKMALVSAQYKADKADALAILGGLSLSDFSTEKMDKIEGDDCKTYQEHVQHLINDAVKEINDADSFNSESVVKDYADAKDIIEDYFDAYNGESAVYNKLVVEKGYEVGSDKVGLGVYEINKAFRVGNKTLNDFTTDVVNAQGAVSEAGVAAVKADIAKLYAQYLTTTDADKTFAANLKKVLDFLAEQGVVDAALADQIQFNPEATFTMGNDEVVLKDTVADAIAAVERFEARAAQLAAEKDENGVLVRDAKDVADLVTEGTTRAYGEAINQTDRVSGKKTIAEAEAAIVALHASLDGEKLAYAKKLRETFVAEVLEQFEDNEKYYPLELAKVKAVTDEYLAKVNAVTDLTKVDDYDVSYLGSAIASLDPEHYAAAEPAGKLTNIETATDVNGKTDGDNGLKAAAADYATLLNRQLKDADKYYLGTNNAKLNAVVNELVGNSEARTAKEITALSDQVLAAVKGLPTNAEVEAAYDAVVDAAKALPTTVTTADKAAIDAAKAALKAYKGLSADDNHGSKPAINTAVTKYAYAYNNEISAKVNAVNSSDKAAIKAIKAEISDFVDTYGNEGVFTDNKTTLNKYLTKIQQTEAAAVRNAISAIPVKANLTEASKDKVVAARKLYDAYVAEYTDTTDYDCAFDSAEDGFVADDFDYNSLVQAETLLGITATENADENAKAYVQDLKIVARSVKTAKGNIKVTVKANVQPLIDAGYKVEYKFFRSTKARAKYQAKLTKTTNTYTNTTGKKGVRYYYKAKLVVKNAAGEIVAVTPLTQCRYACRVK